MDFIMYQSSAEKVVLNKESYLSNKIDLKGYLRDDCDILNPVIEIEKAYYAKVWYSNKTEQDIISVDKNKIPIHNYIYIPQFNRYYFVDNIISTAGSMWRFELSVDVLMSFKSDILNLRGIVKRSTVATRNNIKDEAAIIPANYTVSKVASEVQSPIMKDYTPGNILQNLTSKYIWCILTASTKMTFYAELFSDSFYYDYPEDIVVKRTSAWQSSVHMSNAKFLMQYAGGSVEGPQELGIDYMIQDIMTNADQVGAVISLMMYPFNLADEPFFQNIKSGMDSEYLVSNTFSYSMGIRVDPDFPDTIGNLKFNIGSATDPKYNGAPIANTFNNKILIGRFDFRDYDVGDWTKQKPYTKFYIYIPFLGYRELDYSKIAGKYVELYFVMNWDDGSANVMVISTPYLAKARLLPIVSNNEYVQSNGQYVFAYGSSGNKRKELLLLEENVQVGISIPLSASNEAENARKREAYSIQLAASTIVGVMSILAAAIAAPVTGGASFGLAALAFGGATSIVAGGANYMAQESQIIDKAQSLGNLGNVSASCSPSDSHILICEHSVTYPEDYDKLFGKIDLTTRTISDISTGFVQFAHLHIDGVKSATSNELDKIEKIMMSGFLIN